MPTLNPLSAIASPFHTPSQMDLLSTHQTASHQSHTSNRQVQGSSGPAPLGHIDCKTCSHAPIPLTSLLIHPSSCLQPISNHQSSCRAKVGRAPSPRLWSSTEWGGNQSWISRVASLAGEHLCLAVPGCAAEGGPSTRELGSGGPNMVRFHQASTQDPRSIRIDGVGECGLRDSALLWSPALPTCSTPLVQATAAAPSRARPLMLTSELAAWVAQSHGVVCRQDASRGVPRGWVPV